jgi:hypothetical protein
MTFTYYVAAFVAALGAFTYFCIPKGRYKVAGTLAFVFLGTGAFALSFESVGQPKPIEIEWRKMTGERVIGFHPSEDEQLIYLWVMVDGVPISYARPWTPDAEKMQDEWRKRRDTGDEFYLSDDDEKVAEVRREPQPPPKGMQ